MLTREELYVIADRIGKILNMDIPIMHIDWSDPEDTDLARMYVQVGRFGNILPRFVKHDFRYPAPPAEDEEDGWTDWYKSLEPTEQVGYWTNVLYQELDPLFRVIPIPDLPDDHPYSYMDCYFLVFDRNWPDPEES